MSNKNQGSLRDIYEHSAFGVSSKAFKQLIKKNRALVKVFVIGAVFLAATMSGVLGCLIRRTDITLLEIIANGFWRNIIVTLVLYLVFLFLGFRACAILYRETEIDEDRNFNKSATGYNGTNDRMGAAEKEDAFISGNYAQLTANIVGAEPDDVMMMHSIKPAYGINGNVIITGAPGSGKSRCFAIPNIMQTIRRGESMIITDPKGELYGKTASMARAHGYTVKILNFNPRQMVHSDTCDYMSVVGKDDLMAMSFASTIVQNTSNGKEADFWDKSELNLLTASILYIANNNIGIDKTLGGVHQLLTTNTVESLETLFFNLPQDHPALGPFRLFANGDKTVKGNTLAGLGIRLQVFNNPLVRKLTGTKDIDFTLPGREKCLYFIGSSDQDDSMSFLVALFFTLLYQELVNYADSLPGRALPIKVTMLLDEFANIGIIPSFDKKLSTVRSRNIDTIIILQDLGQLQKMYPDNVWETIINDCSVNILLRTNSMMTAEYFSKRSGMMTTEETSGRVEGKVGDNMNIHTSEQKTSTYGQREVFQPAEVTTLDPNHILVVVSSHNVAELQKIDYSNHPMNKEIREVVAAEHTPSWIYDIAPEDYDKYNITEKEVFAAEPYEDIELCTDEDFKHPYKAKAQKKVIEEPEYVAEDDEVVDLTEL